MRNVVVAYDGSECGDVAVELVGSLVWAPDAVVSLITVVPDVRSVRSAWGAIIVGTSEQIDEQLVAQGTDLLEAPAVRLRTRGLRADPFVTRGRPSEAIAALAERVHADLIVVGSRGLGPLSATLLGSVSQEVVDHAPSPVLVARAPVITRIVFGTDGSPSAEAAEQALAALPLAAGIPVTVVSVGDVLPPVTTGVAPALYPDNTTWKSEYEAESLRFHQELAHDAAARLRARGMNVTSEARAGDPAGELLGAATDAGANLIVVGSRGRTGLPRLVLGSVARRVVQQARGSVLVAALRDTGHGGRTHPSLPGEASTDAATGHRKPG